MLIVRAVAVAVLLTGLAACARVIEGPTQELTVNSVPPGADCAVTRKGMVVARVPQTPGTVTIEKNRHDINVVCHKDGFETASAFNESDYAAATLANAVFVPPLAAGTTGVDMATGSINKYSPDVTVVLPPKTVRGP